MIHLLKLGFVSIAVLACLGCRPVEPRVFSPQDELRTSLSALPRRRVVTVSLSTEPSGEPTLTVARRHWDGLFKLLRTLTPAPYFASSEYAFLGRIEISGPPSTPTDAHSAPTFSYTITIRVHTPTGRTFAYVTGSNEHAGFPYGGDEFLRWYQRVLREGA